MNDMFQDWLFRYNFVYRNRRSKTAKQRFLQAFVTDIMEVRQDVTVIAYNEANYHSRNVYVGDINRAKTIICSYYDTPPSYIGSYVFLDRKEQGKRTIQSVALGTGIMLMMGFIGLFTYMKVVSNPFDFTSLQTWLTIAIVAVYFICLGKVTKGLSSKKTLIRNTSSLLTMLSMMKEIKDSSIAYAFVDEGSFGEIGLDIVKAQISKKSQIIYLDSVGANTSLHFLGDVFKKKTSPKTSDQNKQVNYIIGAQVDTSRSSHRYYLSKKELNQKTMSLENMTSIINQFSK